MRKLTSILFFAALATQLGATNCGQALRDPGYDLWCGEELCAWKKERGDIKRVPTWNKGDSGVELVGEDAAISQLSPVDSADGQCRDIDGSRKCTSPDDVCLEFSLLSNIDEEATVDLNIDVFGDGTVEFTQRLPLGKWQPLAYKIVIGQPFAGIRFELAKHGPGVAQLANIGAHLAENCDGLPVIAPGGSRPLGAPCAADGDCESMICGMSESPIPFPGLTGFLTPVNVCLGCSPTKNCTSQVCGVGDATSPVRAQETVCIPFNSKELGESCFWFNECKSNFCNGGVCSTCKDDGSCSGGEHCGEAWPDAVFSAWVCNPNAGVRSPGEPCASAADCASGVCNGTERRQCDDGRSCVTAAQCPFKEGLKNGPCTTVGIQGGICQ